MNGSDDVTGMCTYVWVVADLLNDIVVEMTSITLELVAEIESVLHASKNIIEAGDGAALAEFKALLLATAVNILNPGVVGLGLVAVDMVLELDDVGTGDGVGVGGIQNGSRVLMNGADLEG